MGIAGSDLFPQQGLLQEDGILSERWQQQGSDIFNLSAQNNNSATLYTVTSGKTLYVTTIAVSDNGGTQGVYELKDATGGDVKFKQKESVAAGDSHTFHFTSPITFSTEIYCNESTECTSFLTITGWEEDA